MRGGIQKKGNNYYAVVYDGIDPAPGASAGGGFRRGPGGRTPSGYWRISSAQVRRRPRPDRATHRRPVPRRAVAAGPEVTAAEEHLASYRRNIDLHVVPALGRRPLAKLTAEDLDLLRNIHLMLAFADAARKGLVRARSRCSAMPPRRRRAARLRSRRGMRSKLAEFLDAVRSHRLHPAFHLGAHTGMRRGEVLGLR